MYKEREEDLSVLKAIKDLFAIYPFIRVVEEFPDEEITAPTISVTAGAIEYQLVEIGSRNMLETRVWYFDIFCKDKSQRDEFAYKISDFLRNNDINVLNFGDNINNPNQVKYCLTCESLSIQFVPTVVEDSSGITHRAYITATFVPTEI